MGDSYNLGETSGHVKQESFESDIDNSMDALDLLCLASCTTQLNEENIDFNSTEIMQNPFNDKMCCLHCLQDVEKDQVSNHMVHEHGYRKLLYKCQVCLSTFELRPELLMHKSTCKVQPKKPRRKTLQQILKDLDMKVDLAETDSTAPCPICLLELSKTELKDHIIEIHSNPFSILTCGICNRNFKSKITLRDHIKLIHEVSNNQVPCEICGQIFRSKKYLSNHRRNVHPKGDKEFKCIHCGKLFKSHLCLHQHMKYVHPPDSAMATCPQCPKVFKSKINLHQHIKITHLGQKKGRKY